jgi:hypothetical protein
VSRLGVLSLLASLTGTVALLGDVFQLVVLSTVQSPLELVFSVANVVGFLFGLISRCGCGTAGLHLSWAPVVVVLLLLAAYEPELAAGLVRRTVDLVFAMFGALADLITVLFA